MSFIGDIYKGVVDNFQEPIASNAKAIAMAVQPLVMSCFLLYVLFLVYKLYNNKDFIFEEIINAMLLFAVIGTFTYGGSYYYDYVIPFVTGAGDEISSKFLGGEGSSVTVIEAIFKAYDNPIQTLQTKISEFSLLKCDVGLLLSCCVGCIFLWLSKVIFTLMIVVNLLISKVMVTLLLSVGIIFFCFAIFPATRNLFTAFVGSALNYIFLNIMYCLAASLTVKIVQSQILDKANGNAVALAGSASTILISTIIIVLAIKEIPSLVSGLTGGVSIGSNAFNDMLANRGKRLTKDLYKGGKKALGNTAGRAGKWAGGKVSGAWNKMRGNASIKGA